LFGLSRLDSLCSEAIKSLCVRNGHDGLETPHGKVDRILGESCTDVTVGREQESNSVMAGGLAVLVATMLRSLEFGLLCATVLSPDSCAAQQATASESQEAPAQFKSTVNVVLVPVLVRDGDGRLIQDLKQQDFEVFDRGKRQVISHLTVQRRPGAGEQQAIARKAPRAENMPEPAGDTPLALIRSVVRSMSAAPGQRTLVLISPGFLVSSSPLVRLDVSRLLDVAAQSNVMISALDARGLYTDMLDVSQRGKLPSDVDPSGAIMRLKEQNRRDALAFYGGVMDELASGTGGTYFRDSNDLAGGFARVTKMPECLYVLEFSPADTRRDGSFHRLSVKVKRKGVKVRARQGYFSQGPEVKK